MANGARGLSGVPAASPVCQEPKSVSGHVTSRLRPMVARSVKEQ